MLIAARDTAPANDGIVLTLDEIDLLEQIIDEADQEAAARTIQAPHDFPELVM
jgi:hypothetical protein